MGLVYIDEYETRKAYSELDIEGNSFTIEYVITSPIDGKPNNVNAYINKKSNTGDLKRVGYGMYDKNITSLRFDASNYALDILTQQALGNLFYQDMVNILS